MTEHKTDMDITKNTKDKTEQHFYRGAQNRYEHITINICKSNKRVTSLKTPHEKG